MNSDNTFLSTLEDIIQQRIEQKSERSYTAQLVASGDLRVAQKVGEEALELALAAIAGSADRQLEEAADLVFHLLVLLRTKGISLTDVSAKLQQRHLASDTDHGRSEY